MRKTKEVTTVAEVLNQLKICVDLHKFSRFSQVYFENNFFN